MSEAEAKKTRWNIDAAIEHVYIDEIIFVVLVFLCFFGEVLLEITGRIGIFYWLLMAPVFFYASVVSEKAKAKAIGHETAHLIKYQIFFWGSAFSAILLVFLAWHAEILKAESVGIIIHITLAHTMFFEWDCTWLSLLFDWCLTFCTAGLTILMEANFAIDLLIILPFIWLGFYWEKKHLFPILKRKSDFVRDIVDDASPDRRAS